MMADAPGRRVDRRLFLRWTLFSGSAALLAACSPAAAPSPTAAPAKPAAPAATSAPAPAAAPAAPPAAASPAAEAAKPAAAAAASPAAAAKPAAGSGRWGMSTNQEAAWKQIEDAANKEGTLTYYSLGSLPQNK